VPLPKPVEFLPKIEVDPNHGLYAFFAGPDKLMNTPAEDREHGRAWSVEELRRKSWDDLQRLWWVCCRERNRISTADKERKRANMGFGAAESKNRDDAVCLPSLSIFVNTLDSRIVELTFFCVSLFRSSKR